MAAFADKDFKISPRYKASQWLALNLVQKDAADWQTAVDIFEDRVNGRFIQQIDVLASNPKRDIGEFAGFAILAMDCLLIESLQQFYLGIQFTPQRQGDKMFHDFFKRAPDLSAFFDTTDKTYIFYSQIRCGILHQAQTQMKSVIHMKKGTPVVAWINPARYEDGVSINRVKFHQAVCKVYNAYVMELRGNHHLDLRRRFEKKMNGIAKQM